MYQISIEKLLPITIQNSIKKVKLLPITIQNSIEKVKLLPITIQNSIEKVKLLPITIHFWGNTHLWQKWRVSKVLVSKMPGIKKKGHQI